MLGHHGTIPTRPKTNPRSYNMAEKMSQEPELNDKSSVGANIKEFDVASGSVEDIDPVFAKRVLRKIDRRVLVCCLITYTFNFIDKTLLGYGAIFGIIKSTV